MPPNAAKGANFGWPTCEGTLNPGCSSHPTFTEPIYEYANAGSTCAITGGYVVRDPELGDLVGRYLFADYCAGDLWSVDPASPPALGGHRSEDVNVESPTSFGEDACGRLYVASRDLNRVFRIEGPSSGACSMSPGTPDTDPPQTELRLLPRGKQQTVATFLVSSDEPGSTFRCRLDKRKWKRCGERRRLRGLDPGKHRFRAQAIDAAGNKDPRPAKRRFRVEPRGA
jgi:hypothetical protein